LAAAEKRSGSNALGREKGQGCFEEAKEQSSEIVIWLKKCHELVEASKDTAKKEGERLISCAKAKIEQEKQQAIEIWRKEVSALALRLQSNSGAEIIKPAPRHLSKSKIN